MKNIVQKKKQEGFTIIEVLIVLAIAGLIMLIVFLAVPALQRNSRNSQRTSDASRIMGAVNECISNKNGQLAPCDTTAPDEAGAYVDISTNQQLITESTPGINSFEIVTGVKCNAAGDGTESSGVSSRSVVVSFQIETRGAAATRCIGS